MSRRLILLALLPLCLAKQAVAETYRTSGSDIQYTGSDTCATCHTEEADVWKGSHHALAWTLPSPDNVVADFDGTLFEHLGVLHQFTQQDDDYRVTITETDGRVTEHDIHSVVGIEPLQQYLIETEPGRLQSFDVVWDVEKASWYHLYPDQNLPQGDGLHWSGPYKNWNARCAECHATGFEKNYRQERDSYASRSAEIGVGCEACHGPGSRHVTWAETVGKSPAPDALPPAGYGFSMDFAAAGTEFAIQQCASCHSRREPLGDSSPLPGTPFHDAYTLALLRPGLYHPDGQVLDEVYVYGSFLQSKMYAKGVGCLDCHNAHSARLKAEDNSLCTQCHSPAGNTKFSSLPLKLYDDPSHHFHETGSEGAQCKSCHMIERTYMGTDGRRDHSFRIPRPDISALTGAPDACTDCHADQPAAWAAQEIEKRFPDAAKRPHYGTVLAAGRANPGAARSDLSVLAQDQKQAGLVRATALWLLAQAADAEVAEQAAALLEDSDPLVRAAAIRVQGGASPQTQVQRIIGLLNDPVRMVRVEAAKAMLNAPIARLPKQINAHLQRAMGEWRASLQARSDYPETHMVLGGMALSMRNFPAAKSAFREVVRMDPQREEAWVMLTRITAAADGREATLDVLDEALEKLPGSSVLQDIMTSVSNP